MSRNNVNNKALLFAAAYGEPTAIFELSGVDINDISLALMISANYKQWDVLNRLLSLKEPEILFKKEHIDQALLMAAAWDQPSIIEAICHLPEKNQPTLEGLNKAITSCQNKDLLNTLQDLKTKLEPSLLYHPVNSQPPITAPVTPPTVDVRQDKLIEKIIRFMEIDSKTILDEAKETALKGQCH